MIKKFVVVAVRHTIELTRVRTIRIHYRLVAAAHQLACHIDDAALAPAQRLFGWRTAVEDDSVVVDGNLHLLTVGPPTDTPSPPACIAQRARVRLSAGRSVPG